MPAKILLADKSITIQKVVEMLFAGRDYEVVSVSDGETALSEAERMAPNVVLADVDLPRVDGYDLAARMKKVPALAQTPVILMMSRDDIYDANKGKQAGILDNIVKPFESQELIGKVKKALGAAPSRPAEPAASQPAAVPPKSAVPPRPAATTASPASTAPKTTPSAAMRKSAAPADIFDIIDEAPAASDLKQPAAPAENESVYEVEPVVEEVEEPLPREVATALPVGPKAVEEMRAGLGLTMSQEEVQPEIVSFESFDISMAEQSTAPPVKPAASAPEAPYSAPPVQPTLSESDLRSMAQETISKMAKDVFAKLPPVKQPELSAGDLWSIAEETVSKMAKDVFTQMPSLETPKLSDDALKGIVEDAVSKAVREALEKTPRASQAPRISESELHSMAEEAIAKMAESVFKNMPQPSPPKIPDDMVKREIEDAIRKVTRDVAKEVIEQVAWEVIPPLAEQMIKEEIERLKAME